MLEMGAHPVVAPHDEREQRHGIRDSASSNWDELEHLINRDMRPAVLYPHLADGFPSHKHGIHHRTFKDRISNVDRHGLIGEDG